MFGNAQGVFQSSKLLDFGHFPLGGGLPLIWEGKRPFFPTGFREKGVFAGFFEKSTVF
jgi:hypothetical protein